MTRQELATAPATSHAWVPSHPDAWVCTCGYAAFTSADAAAHQPTAEQQAQAALAATPTHDLLRTAYRLTHQMDSASARMADAGARQRGAVRAAGLRDLQNLRSQRDLIDAELLRRTGGL